MTSDGAQTRFHEFNQQYFAGKIPLYRVRVVEDLGGLTGGQIDKPRKLIQLKRMPAGDMVAMLLHEMCHAATNRDHGKKWRAEMQRIASLGALIEPQDLDLGLSNKARLMPLAMVFVEGHPQGTVEEFNHYLVTETLLREHYAVTGRTPLERYPKTLPRVFREAQERIAAFKEGVMFADEVEEE